MPIGPELPAHLAHKRKFEDEEEHSEGTAKSPKDGEEKRRRVIGPAMPPAPLEELPSTSLHTDKNSEDDSNDDSEDDFGPAPLPMGSSEYASELQRSHVDIQILDQPSKPQRDEWMLVPPSSEDWSSRVDPTKLRSRKFNTGKGAKAPAQKVIGNTTWTETPEEKRKRLEDEVMGVKPAKLEERKADQDDAKAREMEMNIRKYDEKYRNSSLLEEHKQKGTAEKEDDPSKRAFDKEKDIGGGIKIDHAKRKELLARAADFSSRFQKGSYL